MDGVTSGLLTVAPELFTRLVKGRRGAPEEAAEPHRCVLRLIIFYTFLEEQIVTAFEATRFPPIQREA
jgi:dihydrodipicolinate synthase/N-acetylneuraminate lyase